MICHPIGLVITTLQPILPTLPNKCEPPVAEDSLEKSATLPARSGTALARRGGVAEAAAAAAAKPAGKLIAESTRVLFQGCPPFLSQADRMADASIMR